MVSGIVVAARACVGTLGFITAKGWAPYLWKEWITSVDHKRIGVMYCLLALVMLLRGFSDAIMMRSQQALALHSNGFLPPEHYDQVFSGAWHDHDLLRVDAVHDRADELCGAAAAGRARRGVPDAEFRGVLADGDGRPAGQHVAGHRRVPAHRLAALSAAVGDRVLAGRGGRLLALGVDDLRRRHAGGRHKHRDHHPEDARAGHGLPAHADVLLDLAGVQPPDRGRLPDPDRHLGHAAAGSLPSASTSSPTRPAAM